MASRVLVVVASVAIMLAVVAGYVRRAAVDSDQFANRATAALRDDSVRTLVAERVTDEIVLKRDSNLTAARPVIQSIVSTVIGGPAFTGAFRAAVRDVHRAVFDRDQHTVTLAVRDVGTIVAAGVEVVQPSLAKRLDTTRRVEVVRRDIGDAAARGVRAADTVRLLAWAFLALALVAVAGAVRLSADRRRTVVHLGVGVAIAGLVLVVGLDILRSVAIDHVEGAEARAAAGAVWDAFLRDLHTAGWILAASGAVVAAAADSLIRPVDIDAPLRRAAAWLTTEPARPAWKAVRGVALVAAGLLLILDRGAVLALVFTATGLYVIYTGVSAILWLVHRSRVPSAGEAPVAPVRRRRHTALAIGVAGLFILVAAGVFVGNGGTSTAAPAATACNGHRELCDRTLPEVALAATHNSMAAPLPGWFASEQDAGIADQLRDGIRGLLIDTHYADRLANGRLRTDVGDTHKLRAYAQRDGVSPDAVDAALRLRGRLGFSGKGERGIYLCHTFCELGGTRLSDALRDLHDFLVANPGAVVVVINQDYVTPEDFVGAVEKAKLAGMAYRGPTSGRWWTLRQMIDRNQRVVFLAEAKAGAAPWYHLAYRDITEETPYTFSRPAQLTDPATLARTCRPNRGPEGAPLFLVNHWISTDPVPLPSHADTVNASRPLLARLRECGRIRDHLPNLVAVNFYRRGDLFRVVDALNGVG
jgi:hypothetical protein